MGDVRKGSRRRRGEVEAVLLIPAATVPSQVSTETKSYTFYFIFYLRLPMCESFVSSKALFQLVCISAYVWEEEKRKMKLHNERLRMFLEQCSFFLVT